MKDVIVVDREEQKRSVHPSQLLIAHVESSTKSMNQSRRQRRKRQLRRKKEKK
jgi:hypothetical protein